MITRIIYTALLLLISASLYAQEWRVANSGLIRVQHHPDDEDIALLVIDILDDQFEDIAKITGYTGEPIGNFVITSSPAEFAEFTGGYMPSWSEASTDYVNSVIILKSPNFTGNSHGDFERSIIHELSHFVLGTVTNPGYVPRWFNEGLASYVSGEERFRSKILISRAVFLDSYVQLREVRQVLSFDVNRANLAYAISREAVVYLIELGGKNAVKDILRKLRANYSFERAFKNVIRLDLLDFEIQLRERMQKKYKYYFIASIDDYIWFLIPMLFILAYIVVKFKNWRTIKRWELEDLDAENDE